MVAMASSLPLPWMAKLFLSFLSFLTHVLKSPSASPLGSQQPRPKTKLFVSVFSFLTDAVKGAPPRAPPASPPLAWTTRLLISAISFLTDVIRRPDGTVRRYLSRLDITVGANAKPVRGVRTADVTVDPDRNLWFRLFLPASLDGAGQGLVSGGKTLPVIVFFHGGGFAFLSPATQAYDAVCRRMCLEIGAAVVSVNYRLSPEHRCPSAYDDGLDVLRYLDSHGRCCSRHEERPARGGGDLLHRFFEVADFSNCFVAGDSAGANIAHHVTRRWSARDCSLQPHERVRLAGLMAIQPFFGGEVRVESELRLAGAPLVNTERTDWLWKAFLPEGANRDHEAASPTAATANLGERFPPAMVVVGGFDPLQDWQRRYYQGLRQKGAMEAKLVEYPDAIHGFYVFPELEASTALLVEEMRGFVQELSVVAAIGKKYT